MDWVSSRGTPWVKISDATGEPGRFISQTKEFIKNEGRSKSVVVHPGDLVVSNSATPGLPKFLRIEACVHDGWLLLRNFKGALPEFLYYVVLNDRKALVGKGSGSVFTNLKTEILKNHEISLPTIPEQKRISDALGQIDDLIALNITKSKTLEDIAQTIFKSWFIVFDPVKGKMAGEKPAGMDAAAAELFPDSMEESELGLIPKGWELKKVEEVLKRITVKGLPKSTVLLNLGRTLVLEQGDSVIAGFIDEEADVEATTDSPAFVFGDHTCRMRISTKPFSIFPNTIVLTSELIDTYWAFGATWGLQKFETYRRHWMELAYKVLIVPNAEIASVYGEQVKPLFELIDSLMVQNRVLSALRDDLLPRLISGELQIPEEVLVS
jgi:type I restriction enzyme S subunit